MIPPVGEPAADTGAGFDLPISVFAELTSQAILLIEMDSKAALFVSQRACDLLLPKGQAPALVMPLHELFEPEEGLFERLQIVLATSRPVTFGVKARGSNARIAAKAQRLHLDNRAPLLLVSLKDDPELSRRFRSLSREILDLNAEIERRAEAERSLSSTSEALRRSLALVRMFSEIATVGGGYLSQATEVIADAIGAQSAAMITRSGSHYLCSAGVGTALNRISPDAPLALQVQEMSKVWTEDAGKRDAMLVTEIERASGAIIPSESACVIPVSIAGKPEGAFVGFSDDPLSFSNLTTFEIGIIGESLSSLLIRADMEARLNHGQKLEAIGQLTGGIAHDFNNILAVVLGNAEELHEEVADEHKELAHEIEAAAQRGAILTSQLLSFARKQALRPKSTDIKALVQNFERMMRRSIGEEIDLKVVVSDDLWSAVIDQHQLETALLNLAINARDAMPSGGQLTIEIENSYLNDDYAEAHNEVRAGEYVAISVSDSGTGMDLITAEQAFVPFFTTKGVGKGSGLGLSMVYGFVKQSGGHVKIYSELNHGTVVRMYLPRDTERGSRDLMDDGETLHAVAANHGGRILVVEDDPAVLKYATRTLLALDYEIDTAQNGSDAIDLLNKNSYDVLLTDVVLSGRVDGVAVASHAKLVSDGTAILFMSGYPQSAIVNNRRLDADANLICKPFTRAQLANKLQEIQES